MAGWEAGAALNEAVARDLNERIEAAHEDAGREGFVPMLCECGRADCDHVVPMTVGEYEAVRQGPRLFAIAPGHVIPQIEKVVDDEGRFLVVEKARGCPGDVAEGSDPRQADE